MRKNNRSNILATIILVVLTIIFGCIATKIITTSMEMAIIKINIEDYNKQTTKTDASTEKIREEFELREEMYQSDDMIVRIFSNQNILIKVFACILAIGYYYLAIYVWSNIIRTKYKKSQRIKKKRRKRERKERVQQKYKNLH